MADIRIKDLAVTAGSSASDDYLAVDGSTNGTRKLSAYSPTFGGNLTVSGYADLGSGGIGTPAAGHIQIGGSSSYGAAIIGRGSAYDFGLFNKNGDDVIHVATGTTNVVVSGNLTVSGTGTSSVAGNLTVKSATAYTNFTVGESSNTYSVFFYGANQSNGIAFGTNGSNVPLINGFNNTFTAAQTLALQANGGNLLIGTTTDGGQKLQVAGVVNSSGAGYANSGYQITNTTASRTTGWFQSNSGTTVLRDVTGAADLLSVDTSGNATFVGNLTAKGTVHYFGADNSQRIELTSNNGSSQGLIEFYNRGTSAYFAARYLASSHTFAQGPIAINNTVQTAVSVASTHKVTISIGGTTYYLLATNV